ncbi:MAG: glycosyltransferase [Bacteroidaceae bacterium]|nr:glycosyltransferase [Bacteroidaceae bacterium]
MYKTLSIIIPTYNMETLLPRCLDSLLIKENLDKLEVWVVNDGSKDRSSEIAHQYEAKYPGIFNVIDKPNGNYGSCINAALPKCTGKYVKILDSDDYFLTDNFAGMVCKMQEVDVDLFLSNVKSFGTIERTDNVPRTASGEVLPITGFKAKYLAMHQIAYRTELLKNIGYKQTEGISYTDTEWDYFPMFHVQNFYYMNEVVYMYFNGRAGQTMAPDVIARNTSQFETIMRRMLNHYDSFDKSSLKPEMLTYLDFRNWAICSHLYRGYVMLNPSKANFRKVKAIDDDIRTSNHTLYNSIGELSTTFLGIKYKHINLIRKESYTVLLALVKINNSVKNFIRHFCSR